MKATFVLTWEEFAELYTESWPRPDKFSAIVVSIVALPLIAYGISGHMVAELRDEKVMLAIFWGLPLLLLTGAVLSVTSQAKAERKRTTEEARRLYDRSHTTQQNFSFDQEKWTLETGEGKAEASWLLLQHAIEWPNVIYLATERASAILPKRAFTPEGLSILRQLAFPISTERWFCRTSCWDYQAAETTLLWRKHWFRMGFGNLFCLVVLVWILQSWLSPTDKAIEGWGWVIALFALVLLITAQIWYLPLKYATSVPTRRLPEELNFSERGLYSGNSHCQAFTSWHSFRKFIELGRAFLIYSDRSNYALLSKHYFSIDQQNEIRRLLEKHVSKTLTAP